MKYYAGFDSLEYPTKAGMIWLSQNTNLVWCGYYLAPAPNRHSSGWCGQYNYICRSWGVLPIYVGQQDPRTANEGYTPSSNLTIDQGAEDANDAIDLQLREGFPIGGSIYLDWEYGWLDGAASKDYIKSWISTIALDRRFIPGIYCSHLAAQAVGDLINSIDPTPMVRLWCWKVTQSDAHAFDGDISNLPEVDPAGCGFHGAEAWQREQRAIVTFPDDAPIDVLEMDFSTASLSNPGGPAFYEAVAETLETALALAHDNIRQRTGRDFTVSRVNDWGMQYGGFARTRRVWVQIVEDPVARFRPDTSPHKPHTNHA